MLPLYWLTANTNLCQDLKLPKHTPQLVKTFLTAEFASEEGVGHPRAIPFWDPYPDQNIERSRQDMYCTPGDVGLFDDHGLFCVLMNIFKSKDENLEMNYKPPLSFEPFIRLVDNVPSTRPLEANGARPCEIYKVTMMSSNFMNCGVEGWVYIPLSTHFISGRK